MRSIGVLRILTIGAIALQVVQASVNTRSQARHLSIVEHGQVTNLNYMHDMKASVARVLTKKKVVEEVEEEEEEAVAEEEEETPAPTAKKTHKTKHNTPPPVSEEIAEEEEEEETVEEETPAPKKKVTHTPPPTTTEAPTTQPPRKFVKEKKIGGKKNEGVIDHSSEGSAEIDKIDLRNQDSWVSVYDDPPLLVIKASLYAFIAYNDTNVCQTFNMTMSAVEQKEDGNGTFSYHVVADINCTRNGQDETEGKFVLNFIPEGRRLLLTECGHREEGEILNWLMIKDEVPECMTPDQRRNFLAQPMKHVHATNETYQGTTGLQAKIASFETMLSELDGEEMAEGGAAVVVFCAIAIVLVVFIARRRKAQKDLERTIAGAKAEHAMEDENTAPPEGKERKGLMDSAKAKPSELEEGSFVNSPAVKV